MSIKARAAAILCALFLGVLAAPQPAAAAGACSPYVSALTPLMQKHVDGKLKVWARVKVASNGTNCVGHDLVVTLQARQVGGTWGTYGAYSIPNYPASELGATWNSIPLSRQCGFEYRSRYRLDAGLTVTGVAVRYC